HLLGEQVDAACLPAELAALLASTHDPVLRETLRDYGLDRSFRRDLFVRGPEPLAPAEAERCLLDQEWVLAVPRGAVPDGAALRLVSQWLGEAACGALLDAVCSAPVPLRAVMLQPPLAGVPARTVHDALMLLASSNAVMPALPAALRRGARASV
ncbi:methyltransferase regulatory domain-containing protein, partial [Streptomyces clavuligerus]|uniref:methyltransferase regulatory domain-containing protein n=1 Tax=Streptomyces clavuligerus TaxID=1901 RepID=UPI0018D1384A